MRFEDYTSSQQQAITADSGVLVTASAGSGKTSVLVERVMNKLIKKGVPIERLLIATFTNAAASEMRTRIEKSLSQAEANDPKNKHIKMQKMHISSAKICTLDSFCIDLVRENFDELEVMPDFKVCDPAAIVTLQEQALNMVLDPMYKQGSKGFLRLLESSGDSYGDDKIKTAIKDIYDNAINLPFYAKWLEHWKNYYVEHKSFFGTVWDEMLCESLLSNFEKAKTAVASVIENEELYIPENEAYKKQIEAVYSAVCELCKATNGQQLSDKLCDYAGCFEADKKRSKIAIEVRNAINAVNCVIDKASQLYIDGDMLQQRYEQSVLPVVTLIELVLAFDKQFYELMRENNSLTFAATEQLALSLLCKKTKDGFIATERGIEISDSFDEIIVDEYQDTNDLQDTLIQVLSNGGRKLFVVGDAKQSIYEFRGTNPANFINKIKDDKNGLNKISLLENFRSSKLICEFINLVFERLMTEDTCGIEYSQQKLFPFLSDEAPHVSFNIVKTEKLKADQAAEAEAALIADYIKNTMANDSSYTYASFAVLMRSSKRMNIYADTLRRFGIPVVCNRTEFLNTREIQLALAVLTVSDNPTKDVQMLAVMMSPLFAFTADELAVLRCDYRADSVWASVLLAAKDGHKKYIELVNQISKYRRLGISENVSVFAQKLFDEIGFEDIVAAMPNGDERLKNLRTLQSLATDYAKTGKNGIYGFVQSVYEGHSIQEGAALNNEGVKIMTMHKSKGLEFPVCIIAGAGNNDLTYSNKESYSIQSELGIAMDVFGSSLASKTISPAKTAIDLKRSHDNIAEEIRLMYVFLTRAKQRLAVFASYGNFERKLSENINAVQKAGNAPDVAVAKSYADLILQALIVSNSQFGEAFDKIAQGGKLSCSNIDIAVHAEIPRPYIENKVKTQTVDNKKVDELALALSQVLEYKYPYTEQTELPSKLSVSEISHQTANKEYSFTKRPAFLSKNQLTPAERGVATHMYMQFCDLQQAEQNPAAELERLCEYQFITEQQANAVDIKAIESFFASKLYERVKNASKVFREIRFLTKINMGSQQNGEDTVLQGVADCVLKESDGLVIIDFKTDRVSEPQKLCELYSTQMKLYAKACQKAFDIPVKECIIYSFVLNQAVNIKI